MGWDLVRKKSELNAVFADKGHNSVSGFAFARGSGESRSSFQLK